MGQYLPPHMAPSYYPIFDLIISNMLLPKIFRSSATKNDLWMFFKKMFPKSVRKSWFMCVDNRTKIDLVVNKINSSGRWFLSIINFGTHFFIVNQALVKHVTEGFFYCYICKRSRNFNFELLEHSLRLNLPFFK